MDYANETTDSLTGYVTAEEDSTRYLSVLETTNEMTLDDLNLTLNNTKPHTDDQHNDDTMAQVSESEELNTIDINGQQVVVYTVDGGEELYGLQFVQDEQGNLQKYQFQLRTNEEGQLEAIPETVHLLPIEDENTPVVQDDPVKEIFDENLEENCTEETIIIHQSDDITETVGQIQEESVQEESCEQLQEEARECSENDAKTDEIEIHYIKEEVFNDEQTTSEETSKLSEVVNFDDENVYTTADGDNNFQEASEVTEKTQCHVQQVESESVEQENVTHYEEVFVQAMGEMDNGGQDQQVGYINHTAEETANSEPDLYYNQNSANIGYNNEDEDSDNDDYQIVEGLHVTGDVEEETNHDLSDDIRAKPEAILKNVCITNMKHVEAPNMKTVVYYVVKHPEKENINSVSLVNPLIYKPAKVNQKSLLKCSQVEQKTSQQEHFQMERSYKRFSRGKEAMEERLFMNFINKTTIPVEPVRQHRLPRKQKIKPIKRMDDEEIVVQEVVVSSNGFVETLEDGILKSKEPLRVTETVTLTDSEDEYDPKEAKKKKHRRKRQKQRIDMTTGDSTDTDDSIIEILSDTDEQQTESDKFKIVPIKGRGRPKKALDEKAENQSDVTENMKSPIKRGRGRPPKASKININVDEDSESPAKKSKTDENEDSPPTKNEIKCPKCTKFFASPNSLKTHLQYHNLENSMKKSQVSKEVISDTNIPKEANPKTDVKSVDKEKSDNEEAQTLIKGNTKTSDIKSNRQRSVATRAIIAPFKRADILYKHKCPNCEATFKNEILLKRHACAKKPMMNKLECSICKKHFSDVAMLNIHKKSHVKTNLIRNTVTVKVSPKTVRSSAVPTFKSPKKYGIYKCKECGKVCSSLAILNAHMKSHKQFSCNTCKSTFPSKILLDTHVRESCVKTKSPQRKRLSFKVKKSFLHSPKRISTRLPLRRLSRKNSVSSIESNTSTATSATPTNRASLKVFDLKCESCNMRFSSYQNLFDHKVLKHGLNTPDKRNIVERTNKRKTLFKQPGTHGGIPASAKLTSAYVALRSKFDTLG